MGLERLQVGLAIFGHWFERALYIACGALLTLISFNMFCAVIGRYVLRAPFPWTEEIARFALVWFALLAAAIAARRGVHISFRWGLLLFGAKVRHTIRVVVELAILGFLSVVLIQSIGLLSVVGNQIALATEMNMKVPYSGVPVGLAAMIVVYTLEVGDSVLSIWTGRRLSFKSAHEAETYRRLEQHDTLAAAPPLPRPE
jgi:TRAP-type C4-dicarboxylate transport system permease small subunit